MKTLYLDLSSGISGDMFVAALIDLGVEASQLEGTLGKLPLDGYRLHVKRGHKGSLEGVKFDVHLSGDHHHGGHSHSHAHSHSHEHSHAHSHEHGHDSSERRSGGAAERGGEHGRDFAQIRQLIMESMLSDWVKQKAVAVFQRLAVAEGRIHGLPTEQVSFHEVGAVDSIVDIVGACVALEMLGKPRIMASPVIEGTGFVECAHGRLPIPAPATLAILGTRGIAVSQCEEPNELVTPTGAALLAEFVEAFGPMHALVAEKIGYGLGTRDNPRRPNALRAILGEQRGEGRGAGDGPAAHDWETDTIAVLETNLDDINAEILGRFVETALAAGALDVFHTAIQMKKNRPGVLLTVLCAEAEADKFCELLVRETSTFGVRRYNAERRKLRREFITVQTTHGSVSVKLGKLDGKVLQAAPEFESCKQLAEETGVPVKEVYHAALRAVPSSLR
jgi:pyridinium-3,5-bisthiocarboxylic acid mononucleotide nickel chelatase